MRNQVFFVSIVIFLFCCCSTLWAYTLTFDDIPTGQNLSYYYDCYGIVLDGGSVTDSTALSWASPHSGTYVLAWDGNPYYDVYIAFGSDPNDYPGSKFLPYNVSAVGAYFCTEPGAVLKMEGFRHNGTVAATALIDNTDGNLTDRYVEINSALSDIAYVHIYGTSSPSRPSFCLDDLTITTVPEPSSLLALFGGLASISGLVIRRRQR